MKKRIVCMLLALLLLVGMLPVGVFAEGKTEYEKNETGTAVFNYDLLGQVAYVSDDPTLGWNSSADYTITVDEALLSQTFYIADSYVGESDYWYKLEPLDGETMPEKLSKMSWVYQNDITSSGYADALIITPPANTCRCCESCTGAEDCECGCGECDYCEPVTTDPTTPTDPSQPECGCCENCANAEGCTCGCEACKFCEKEETCGCCENCANAEGCTCGCEACKFCEPEAPADPEIPTVTDTVTGAKVYVETLPEGVTLNVDTNVDGSALLSDFQLSGARLVFAWDISLRNADNTEYQPGGALVKIPVNAAAGTKIGLLHKHSGGTSFMGVTTVLADGTIEFYTDSFSEFAGFTVDFHYNGVDFSIPGMSSIRLSELFEIMEIEENAFAATSVVFSDNSLIGVQQQADGDWLLTSLEAFQTNETLIITFTDGHTIVIDVTDAQYPDRGKFTNHNSANDATFYHDGGPTAQGYRNFSAVSGVSSAWSVWDGGNHVIYIYLYDTAGNPVDYSYFDEHPQTGGYLGFSGDYWYEVTDYEFSVGRPSRIDADTLSMGDLGWQNIWPGPTINWVEVRMHSLNVLDNKTYAKVNQKSKFANDGSGETGNRTVVVYANNVEVDRKSVLFPTFENMNASDISVSTYAGWIPRGNVSGAGATVVVADGVYKVYLVSQNTIKYDLDGGSGSFPNQTKTYGVQLNLHSGEPTKAGYTFNHWVSSYDGSTWAKGANFTPDRADTLVANYSPITYTATFNANGGSVNPTSRTFDIEGALSLPTPTRTGYTFTGWKVTSAAGNWTNAETYSSANIEKGKYGDVTFTAVWKAKTDTKYTVETYTQNIADNNYTKTSSVEKTGETGTTPTISTTPETGFTYNATMSVVSGTIAGNGTTVYKVYFDRNSYTVTTNAGTGISAVSGAGTYKYGASVTINATVADGYTWSNWTGSNTQTTKNYTFTMPDSVVTYTANATANTYKVKFNGNGSTDGSMTDQSFTYDKAQNLTANAFKREYTVSFDTDGGNQIDSKTVAATFNGWATTAAGTKDYNDKQSVNNLTTTNNATVNLYAMWSATPSVTLPTPTKTGFDFKGWYTNESFTEVTKVTGTTYTPTSDVTLYAKWESIGDYKVTYQYEGTVPSGAPAVPAAADVHVGDPVTVKNTANITGYTFSGWTTSDAEIKDGKFTMPAKAVTLTGKWIPISYTVKFNGNSGTGSVADIDAKYGEEVTLPDNGFRRVVTVTYDVNGGTEVDPDKVELEAAFNGWKKENSGDTVAAGTKVSNLTAEDRKTVTYYADWEYRSTTTPTTAKAGYAFGGWTNGGTEMMEAGKIFTPTTNIKLTAVWTANAYTITYDLDGGKLPDGVTSETQSYNVEQAVTLMAMPTKEGYKFTGWELEKAVTEPNGNWDADTYSAAQKFEKGKYGDIKLVAQWEEQYRYVLNFDANGGSGAPATITEEWCDDKEHTFTWTEVPTRTGYTFMGWAEDAASEENVAGADKNSIKLDGEAAETVSKTIFAIWKRDTGTINLNYSGGVPVVVTVTCTDAVNDSEKITINTVITGDTTIKDLPTGTYKVTAESGNANYTASVNPGSTQLKSGETANFELSVSDRGFNWLTGFAHVINKRGG